MFPSKAKQTISVATLFFVCRRSFLISCSTISCYTAAKCGDRGRGVYRYACCMLGVNSSRESQAGLVLLWNGERSDIKSSGGWVALIFFCRRKKGGKETSTISHPLPSFHHQLPIPMPTSLSFSDRSSPLPLTPFLPFFHSVSFTSPSFSSFFSFLHIFLISPTPLLLLHCSYIHNKAGKVAAMTKKPSSSKKSKQKGGVNITNPAVFLPQEESTQPPVTENNSSGGLPRPTSFASSHTSLSSLTDLDYEPSAPPPTEAKQQLSSLEKTKEPSPAVITRSSRLSQQQHQAQETEGDDLWSWITATHSSVPLPPFAPSRLDPDSKRQNQHNDIGTQEKEEKKQAKPSWYETQRQESLWLCGRDWATLSALTVATMSVRLWCMDASPAEVV